VRRSGNGANVNYFAEGGELFIVDHAGKLLWRGNPKEQERQRVSWAAGIPQSNDGVVLFDYPLEERHGTFANLIRITPSGTIVFHAELPEKSGDFYVRAEIRDGKLIANSWSCYRVSIDISTGLIIERVFTK
jgi:hypothetical protein